METVYQDYANRGVRFYYIYKALAHPETNGFITPYTLEERLSHVAQAKERLGTEFTWLCDSMDNAAKHALGDRPNSEFVIDPDGNIIIKRSWSNPRQLRTDLAELVGQSPSTTTVADLEMPRLEPPQNAPTGIVDRLVLPGRFQPVVVEPGNVFSDEPYYVKLRAEADNDALSNGIGKIYLGFFLDPIYEVHWNNQVDAPRFEISVDSDDAMVSPITGTGPEVDAPADADPREFMIEVEGLSADDTLNITLHYFACDDAETFCKPMTQEFSIQLQRDRDGGSRMSGRRSPRSRNSNPREGQSPSGPPNGMNAMIRMLESLDANNDREWTRDELPSAMADRILSRFDRNGDGKLNEREFEALRAARRVPR